MSSYHNKFKDGPNDKPKKKKPVRTPHMTYGDIAKNLVKKVTSITKLKNKSRKAINKSGG